MTIESGSNGKENYSVILGSNSSCSYPDYERNGSKVYPKYVICLNPYVLENERFPTLLKERYFSVDNLQFLFRNKDIPELYRQPQKVLKRPRNFQEILESHQDYDGQQQCSLHLKKVKSAKCALTLCKKDFRKGVICFLVEVALTVPFNRDKAVLQKFLTFVQRYVFSILHHGQTKNVSLASL